MNIIVEKIIQKFLKIYIINLENIDFSIYSNDIKMNNIYLHP